ncbi:hypothetical protein F4X10_17485 [Candidatus Poribacteria bacterium]|nr:hypothetical protein [Candidatus Poribacteria bacterium]
MFTRLHTNVAYYRDLQQGISSEDLQRMMIAYQVQKRRIADYHRKMIHAVKKHSEIVYKLNSDMRKAMMNLTQAQWYLNQPG